MNYSLQGDTENAELGVVVLNGQNTSRLPCHWTLMSVDSYNRRDIHTFGMIKLNDRFL